MRELPSPSHKRKCSASEASMVAKSSNTPTLFIFEKFEIEQSSFALRKSAENVLPSTLALVA